MRLKDWIQEMSDEYRKITPDGWILLKDGDSIPGGAAVSFRGDETYYRVENLPIRFETTAPNLLRKSSELLSERGKQYDKPDGERSMGKAVKALNTILGREAISESEGWLLMQILKDVRDRTTETPHVDSLEDCIAYAALKAESRMLEKAK